MSKLLQYYTNLEIIVSHKNCLDGYGCVSIISNIAYLENRNTYKIFMNPGEKIGISWIFNIMIWLLSFIITIRVIFADIIVADIYEFVEYYKKTNIQFEIYDHHHTQIELVKNLEHEMFDNLLIKFEPELKYGATYLIMKKYEKLLTRDQILFYTKLAACDMWNLEEFPELNYFIFGLNNFCYLNNKEMIDYDVLWDSSFDGDFTIQMFVNQGCVFYSTAKIILEEWISNYTLIYKYNNYNILLININDLPQPYNEMKNMVSLLSYYLRDNNTINVLATYSTTNYVSLRCINSNVDVSELAKRCDGGGHKKASGCRLDRLMDLIKIDKINLY